METLTAQTSARKLLAIAEEFKATLEEKLVEFSTNISALSWSEGQLKSIERLKATICDKQIDAETQQINIRQLADIVRRGRKRLEELEQRLEERRTRHLPPPPTVSAAEGNRVSDDALARLETSFAKKRRH